MRRHVKIQHKVQKKAPQNARLNVSVHMFARRDILGLRLHKQSPTPDNISVTTPSLFTGLSTRGYAGHHFLNQQPSISQGKVKSYHDPNFLFEKMFLFTLFSINMFPFLQIVANICPFIHTPWFCYSPKSCKYILFSCTLLGQCRVTNLTLSQLSATSEK